MDSNELEGTIKASHDPTLKDVSAPTEEAKEEFEFAITFKVSAHSKTIAEGMTRAFVDDFNEQLEEDGGASDYKLEFTEATSV